MENSNKPAFPFEYLASDGFGSNIPAVMEGLTKREYFAGMAMQGLSQWLINPSDMELKNYAANCVTLADYTLQELEKQNK